jgi:hypothetical protein
MDEAAPDQNRAGLTTKERNLSNKRNAAAWGVVGGVTGALIMVVSGAFADGTNTGTLELQPGTNLNITCPNALSNTNVAAESETVNCAANTTTTTTVAATTTSTGGPSHGRPRHRRS